MLDAFIEQRAGAWTGRVATDTTDRADDTTLTILDPVAITDELTRFDGADTPTRSVRSMA